MEKLLYSFLSAGVAKLEIAALSKPWVFQAYLGTDEVPISTETGLPSGKEYPPLTIPLNDG